MEKIIQPYQVSEINLENKSNQKILLIGGAGYIGSVITSYLLEKGYHVCCFDRLLYNNHSCVLPNLSHPRYEFVYGDMLNSAAIDSALNGVKSVVLLAGLVGDPVTNKYPVAAQKVNIDGVRNVLQLLKSRELDRVIFISTCSNYGLIESDVSADELFELKPLSLYAKAKVAIEEELLSFKGKVGYAPTILRFATAFGLSPRMRFDLTVNEFTRELYYGKELLVYDENTWRPYCHVRDFARAVQKVLEAPREKVAFEIFNAGGEINNLTKQNIVEVIKIILPDAKVNYKKHGTDPRNYRVTFSKIKESLGFAPSYTAEEGIRELIDALRQNLFPQVEQQPSFYGNYHIDY